jgi:hypothetical protein
MYSNPSLAIVEERRSGNWNKAELFQGSMRLVMCQFSHYATPCADSLVRWKNIFRRVTKYYSVSRIDFQTCQLRIKANT